MFKKQSKMCIALLVVGLFQAVTVDAARYYVNWQSNGGNGLSWNEAFDTFETALATVRTQGGTNEIWIADGTYKPTFINDQVPYLNNVNSSGTTPSFYIPGNTHIYGGFEGNETTLSQRKLCKYVTILDGDIDGNDLPTSARGLNENNYFLDPVYVAYKEDNARHVLTIIENQDESETVTLDSLTIQNGFAGFQDGENVRTGYGGGIYHRYGSLTLNNVTFLNNEAYDANGNTGLGGALFSVFTKTLTMTNCEVIDSYASFFGPCFYIHSAADLTQIPGELFFDNLKVKNCISPGCVAATFATQLTLKNSLFEDNFSTDFCGGLQVFDGFGEPEFTKSSLIENTRFINNKGGACGCLDIFNNKQGKPDYPFTVQGCEFKNNLVLQGPGDFKCTTCFYGYDAVIENNQFCDNVAETCGAIGFFKYWWPSDGYLYDYKPTITVKENAFISNKAPLPYQNSSSGAICISGYVNGEDYTLGQPLYLIAEDNYFKENSSAINGGAISLTDGVKATIIKNNFCNNKAIAGYGDAIYVRDSLANNLLIANKFKPLDSNTVVTAP